MSDPRIIVALDFPAAKQALELTAKLDPKWCRVKVGKELFTAAGPQLVEKLMGRGFEVFLDLKFHDIPNTVANACKAAAGLGVWMMNIHALGGRRMLSAAREAVPTGLSKLIAVTLLTSMERSDLNEIGLNGDPQDVVQRLALLAHDCGMDGVVCSALEAPSLRKMMGKDFCLVTPGIRPADASLNEQKRVSTPRQAIQNGVDYLVIGRPVTQACDPVSMLWRLNEEIEGTKNEQEPGIEPPQLSQE
ncbi:orotidine-5'-phosphate decarboxylase [Nitrosovibrio sp. Nv4]|uniref:orotidine-5'-phosphate decarboxylase n=1 Tax=Nitrosovibrio sp. Nv4 TaxID=1945880 RepID=UPI000BC6DAD3|nr:orotidine-5'-phosphate decarboxylase [Nitrosovibrio sp. Nv4]SOD42441.1 orotidine-5'-phosphate decarboxylase [Nitrosovibrio sp. Nv4]